MEKKVVVGMMNIPRVGDGTGKARRIIEEGGFEVQDVTRKEIERGELDEYDVLYCPGGHSVVLSEEGIGNVKKFVRSGGGLVGVCAGCHFIAEYGLLKMKLKIIRAVGIYDMRIIKRHPVTKGFRLVPRSPEKVHYNGVPHTKAGRVPIDRGNGGFIIPGKGTELLATYDNDDEFGAIAAGNYGKGRVVAISCHPQLSDMDWERRGLRCDPRVKNFITNSVAYCAGK